MVRVIVPAYNEAANLPAVCERVQAALAGRAYRLFVVDDGSKDDTAAVAGRLAAAHPVAVVTHPVNRGIAAVFLSGIRAALEGAGDDEPVVIMEGDGTSDAALLPALLSALEGEADIAIASRYLPGGEHRRFPLKRLLLSHGANTLLRTLIRLPGVSDYTIFYRAYRARVLKRGLEADGERLTSVGGFACNAELLLRVSRFCRKTAEVPFVYDYGLKRGKSGMKIGNNLLSYAKLFWIFFRQSAA
ncbi:MAG: glycosyltransferase [Elusimicrobia bacterium]|nr:glycosyltransferase [Elusimicrobiota bacterium]